MKKYQFNLDEKSNATLNALAEDRHVGTVGRDSARSAVIRDLLAFAEEQRDQFLSFSAMRGTFATRGKREAA